ncbi:NAD(P)H-dependent flavin oxidoreductase [Undibacterium oligocarboniphilum]|uniref:Nitronate monooxygenase n=1 Tax=Undibacterium oligocarboniphilum TaxID=666702 RepID=A0A850QFL8_9BURK|nr:nitronate monooxygenase [Undibacterium oligocarboniphilum]MBC3869358.1 nitronate monooxygenase [Undibacterium oligocarboniphilum]NVO77737.1 nitronate monooxygenase [Undibacterium oligocarboniphilum]
MLTMDHLCPYPIIQAPMAGGATTPELVAAVSNAGGLGSLAAPLLSPLAIIEQAEHIRRLTDKPFAINLFVQARPTIDFAALESAKLLLQPVCQELGWEALPTPTRWCEDFESQLDALITAHPAMASFTFDVLHGSQMQRLHDAGILVVGTATNLQEAIVWQAIGADAVCLQGVEAGGHRGTFIGAQQASTLGTMALLKACLPHMQIPLIAAGGIMDGHDIAAMRAAGAQWVQMGTAFLTTLESGISSAYKQRLLQAESDTTRQTRAFSGRYARGLDNRFMQLMAGVAEQVPAYPVQNALTGSIRAAAAKENNTELMSLWCGQGVARSKEISVADLMAELVRDMQTA